MPVQKAGAPPSDQLEFVQSDVLTFPDGLIGCESWRHFVLISMPDDELVKVLQCVDAPEVSFLVTDPHLIVQDYQCTISVGDAEAINLTSLADAIVYCTLTVHDDPTDITANLLGPLVINLRTRLGRQLVLAESNYSTKHPIPRDGGDMLSSEDEKSSAKARQTR